MQNSMTLSNVRIAHARRCGRMLRPLTMALWMRMRMLMVAVLCGVEVQRLGRRPI
jgi:hypothetical protein